MLTISKILMIKNGIIKVINTIISKDKINMIKNLI